MGMNWNELLTYDLQWIRENFWMIALTTLVFIQGISLQALAIHYFLFRRNLKKPRPDGVRFSIIEKTLSLQSEQIDRIYGKLAEFNRELITATTKDHEEKKNREKMSAPQSVENAFVTLGEIQLKRRLQELRGN